MKPILYAWWFISLLLLRSKRKTTHRAKEKNHWMNIKHLFDEFMVFSCRKGNNQTQLSWAKVGHERGFFSATKEVQFFLSLYTTGHLVLTNAMTDRDGLVVTHSKYAAPEWRHWVRVGGMAVRGQQKSRRPIKKCPMRHPSVTAADIKDPKGQRGNVGNNSPSLLLFYYNFY